MSTPLDQPPIVAITVPPELEAGTYANFVAVWHTATEFTLDFAVFTTPPAVLQGRAAASERASEQASEQVPVPSKVVARVKIPPAQAFEIVRGLNDNLTAYEATFGPVPSPGGEPPPLYPPEAAAGPTPGPPPGPDA